MYVISCMCGVLGTTNDRQEAGTIWAKWVDFYHNKAQAERALNGRTDKYNFLVGCFNTLAINEK